jgi:hypothetical protein
MSQPVQVLGRSVRHDRVESPRHYPDCDFVETTRAVAWVSPIPGYGTRSYALADAPSASTSLPDDVPPVTAGDGWIDNGLPRLAVGPKGEVSLSAPAAGVELTTLVRFEDVGDAGDLYTHSPVGRPIHSAWFLGARVLHRGPLRGAIEARWRMRLPAARREADNEPESPGRGGRSPAHVELPLAATFVLDAGAGYVRVAIAGNNRARDHRLRLLFATGVERGRVRADAAFGPLDREPIVVGPEEQVAEAVPPTAPLHRYVTLHDDRGGTTLFSDGLAEYEARDDGQVAVTLVRAVGELSRNDLPQRPGHAGWPVPTPEAQCAGPFAASFALMPHGPLDAATAAHIERAADDVLTPLTGHTLRSALTPPPSTRGLELEGEGLAFSCAKPSEEGDWIVLRCVNVTDRAVRGAWTTGAPIREARESRLDESVGPAIVLREGGVPIEVAPLATVTVLVR